jgi:uncharacterized membrane protein
MGYYQLSPPGRYVMMLDGLVLLFIGYFVSVVMKTAIDIKKINSVNEEDKLKNKIPIKIIEQTSQDEALNILRIRYIDGEITREQYDQMKKDLWK